jgi:O-antigen/teichoic acid export membrane protein
VFEIKYLGYYTLATSLSSAVYFLTKPISVAILPFFTNLVTSNQEAQLQKTFYNVSFITSALTFAVCSNIFYFSNEIIYIWTRSSDLASNASIYLKILVLGYSVSSLQHLSYDVAIANGNIKINNILGIASLIILVPSYWFAVGRFGPEGVAVVFLIVQTISTIIFICTINNTYLDKSRNFRNLVNTYIIPFFISFTFSGIIYFFSKKLLFSNYIVSILVCVISTFFCFVILIFCFDKISELKRLVNSMPGFKKTDFND